ncbi:PQQ-binding-like beta-propeller repeat protein [Spirosoma sp. BT702]|uniref:PQQ-binding-like beta-propeller repeat protein n=1 Tax=Spirosoma profusum TaxID=2771354 RepID=A0A926Y5H7_9BACT|nr:PQQ-binding-like beta-propeller repeat protein [Spirosoma profusum]MBD2704571.1 PQQ-binding-like beta-propeller repeat protein [Spirosoma profusum]
MKSYFLPALLILLGGALTPIHAQTSSLKALWESDTTLRTPESVLYDPAQKVIYVACINGSPTMENKNSFIAKIGPDGKVIKLKFTEGLNSTKGMGILGDKLYVTEMTQVAEISKATGQIVNRYPIPEAKFLNDIAVDTQKKTIYVTDMRSNRIWSITDGKASMVSEGTPLSNPNGLLVDNGLLLIGNGDGSLMAIDPATKQMRTLAKVSGGIDGIAPLGKQAYIVTEWGGKIWHVGADGKTELKQDTSAEKINSADVDYNSSAQVLYVPTFNHHTVKAYSLK